MLIVQAIVSFIAGGLFITLLTLIAERSKERIAGIILMLPSTIVLGLFFLGLATSPKQVALVVPSMLTPLGIVVLSSAIYIFCASFFATKFQIKSNQILATIFSSSVLWFFLASPFAIWKFTNLYWGLVGFFILAAISYLILNRDVETRRPNRIKYSSKQITIRALFSGSIVVIVVLSGKLLTPFWGGLFIMYPAATFSSLMILHFNYEPKQLSCYMKNAPIGSLSLLIYALSSMLLFPRLGVVLGTLVSFCFSLLFSIIVINLRFRKVWITKEAV